MKADTPPPRISVVTPSYQQGAFLESTINSVLSQNYPNLDFIIIDGGSTDGSVEIIKKYANHLSFWCSERDEGHYAAINKGFAQATGEILCWLNSDDMFYPWTLRTVASIFTQLAEVEWISTLMPGFWDRNGFCLGFDRMSGFSKQAFFHGHYLAGMPGFIGYIQQESTFWRKRLWQRAGAGLRPQFSLAADFDLWGQFYAHADLYGVNSPLAGFRMNAGQRSSQSSEYQRQAYTSLLQCRAEIQDFQELIERPLHAKRITRRARDSEEGYWAVEEYPF
jgi:glycosyltransferase involved in cell wall biosynthesis